MLKAMKSPLRKSTAALSRYASKRLRVVGVPEQVNLPIKICQEQGIFSKHGVEVEFVPVPQGTGAMLQKLSYGEADVAITVTDGLIAGCAAGGGVNMIGTFVDSPLIWAAAASPRTEFNTIEEFLEANDRIPLNIGISRRQSGSHTMSYFMSRVQHHRPDANLSFLECGDFEGLRAGIKDDSIALFLWETFTTKPWFDSNELKKLGEVCTPWPSFSFAAASSHPICCDRHSPAHEIFTHHFLPALAEGAVSFQEGGEASVQMIVEEFGHQPQDARAWLGNVKYALPHMQVNVDKTMAAIQTLQLIGLVPGAFSVDRLLCTHTLL